MNKIKDRWESMNFQILLMTAQPSTHVHEAEHSLNTRQEPSSPEMHCGQQNQQ